MSRHTARVRAGNDRASLYSEITDNIIAGLEAGRIPWVQPWGTAPIAMPRNAAPTNNERLRLAVKQELSDFVKIENEFNVQQRRERAAQLGLGFDQLRRKSATELNNLRRGG
jgi:hypothetical protein